MSPRPASCPHELRPGTTVCLLCRHAEHLANARRRQRLAARLAAAALALGIAVVGVRAVVSSPASSDVTPAPTVAVTAPSPAAAAGDDVAAAGPATAPAERRAPEPPAPAPAAVALVAEGRTELRDGLVAVRSGDTVAVHFDTPATRTRRFDKFERIVRETLPQVYGAVADSVLARVPAGQLARSGDLLTELPERGVHLPTGDGGTLALWPETRPGRDGPLVVTYRATLARDGTR